MVFFWSFIIPREKGLRREAFGLVQAYKPRRAGIYPYLLSKSHELNTFEITPKRQSELNLERDSKLQTFCEIVNHSSVNSSLLGSCGFRRPGTVLILQLMPEIYQIKECKVNTIFLIYKDFVKYSSQLLHVVLI